MKFYDFMQYFKYTATQSKFQQKLFFMTFFVKKYHYHRFKNETPTSEEKPDV